jgi:geranylgeranyl pyrophosphate synthase
MFKDNNFYRKEFKKLAYERGEEFLKRFKELRFTGIEDTKLLSILEDVKAYWTDRYRPALISLSCEVVGGNPEKAHAASLIIALVVAGTGIHDDIIDQSTTKFFRRTIFGRYKADEALLVGDFLIVQAQSLIRKVINEASAPQKVKDVHETVELFLNKICDGEFKEISCRKNIELELEEYHKILWKLGSDFEASARLGAILGDGSKSEVEALSEFGTRLGYINRLAGDVKDTLNLEGNLPHRLQFESVPLPILYAAKNSSKNFDIIKSILKHASITTLDIKRLLELCFETKAFSYIQTIAQKNVEGGIKHLYLIKQSKARKILALMIEDSIRQCIVS